MYVFETIRLIPRAIVGNRPGNARKLLEVSGIKGGTTGCVFVRQEYNGKIGFAEGGTVHEEILANGWGVVGQP